MGKPKTKTIPPKRCSLYPHRETSRQQHGLRAYLSVGGKFLQVYELDEWGTTVMGTVQAELGEEFTVGLYDGRKKIRTGYAVDVYFGDDKKSISGLFSDAAFVKSIALADKDDYYRFAEFDRVRVDNHHVRPFRFAKVPTTDKEGAENDDGFIARISTVTIKYRLMKQAPRRKKTQVEKVQAKETRKQFAAAKKSGAIYQPETFTTSTELDERRDKADFAMTAALGDLIQSEVPKKKRRTGGKGEKAETADAASVPSAAAPSDEDEELYNLAPSGGGQEYVYVNNAPEVIFQFKIRSSLYIDKVLDSNFAPKERPDGPKTLEEDDGAIRLLDSDDSEDEKDIADLKKQELDKELAEEYEDYLSDDSGSDEDDEDDDEEADWYAPSSKEALPPSRSSTAPARVTRARGSAAVEPTQATSSATASTISTTSKQSTSSASSLPASSVPLPPPTTSAVLAATTSRPTLPPTVPSLLSLLLAPTSSSRPTVSTSPLPTTPASIATFLAANLCTILSAPIPAALPDNSLAAPVAASFSVPTGANGSGGTEEETVRSRTAEPEGDAEVASDDEGGAAQVAQLLRPEKEQAGVVAEKTADPLPSTSTSTSSDVQPLPPPSYIAAQPAPPPSISSKTPPSPSSALPGAIPASISVTPQSSLSSVPSPRPADADSAQSVAPAPPSTAEAGAPLAVPSPAEQSATALQPATAPSQQATPTPPAPSPPSGTAAALPIALTPPPAKADLDPPLPSQRDLPDRDELRRKRKAEEELDEKPDLQRIKLEEMEEKKVDLLRVKKEEEEKKAVAAAARAKEKEAQYDWSQGI